MPKRFCWDANSSKRGFPALPENPLNRCRRVPPVFRFRSARDNRFAAADTLVRGKQPPATPEVILMTMPETPAALWLRHVLDDESEPLYQELRTGWRADAP